MLENQLTFQTTPKKPRSGWLTSGHISTGDKKTTTTRIALKSSSGNIFRSFFYARFPSDNGRVRERDGAFLTPDEGRRMTITPTPMSGLKAQCQWHGAGRCRVQISSLPIHFFQEFTEKQATNWEILMKKIGVVLSRIKIYLITW